MKDGRLLKWRVLVGMLLLMPLAAWAQNTGKLAGRVIDASTGEPLPGASIVLEGTQRGTTADVDGNYFIIGVPVGTHNIQASFVGFQTATVQGVEINAGYTRELNFELQPGVELTEIVVEYERPLIQKDAIGAPKVVSGEAIQNLPVRGVTNVAALQGGVVNNAGSDDLFVRGGREEQVTYYIDGVKVIGGVNSLGVPLQAVQEQEMLIGSIPARYGDAMSGVISITTKSGAPNFFGSIEAITSEVLDGYGYNLGSLTLGGPIVPRKASFFLSAQGTLQADANPFAIKTDRLSDADFAALQQHPQVLQVRNEAGGVYYVPLPQDLQAGTLAELAAQLQLPAGDTLTDGVPINAPDVYTRDMFSATQAKSQGQRQYDLAGNVTLTPFESVSIRLGGTYAYDAAETYNYQRSLYANDRFYNDQDQTWRAYGTWRQYLSGSTFYQIQADFTDDRSWYFPEGYSRDIEDVFSYGDIDDARNGVLASYMQLVTSEDEEGHTVYSYARRNNIRDGSTSPGAVAPATFLLPGVVLDTYQKAHNRQFRLSANATTQVGVHQIEFGGEMERRTQRYYSFAPVDGGSGAANLARYFNDGSVEAGAGLGVDRYEELPFEAFKPLAIWYGYDFRGLKEVDDQDVAAYADATAGSPASVYNVAPYQPLYYAGYLSDKIEYKDLVLSLGLRVDVFDNNALVLKDPYALVPIVRAGDLEDVTLPDNVGADYAVYYAGEDVIGYRDLDGNFFDARGQESTFGDLNRAGGRPKLVPGAKAFSPDLFREYKPQVTFMPRIGVSFPVTDQALFFASYNVTSQRPSEREFTSFMSYQSITGQSRINNPDLKPEMTTQYELGFRQSLGARAALQISGFYRRQDNLIQVRDVPQAFPAGYQSYRNVDFAVTKGAEIEFDLRRTKNVSLNANYTLSFAQGTGSDAASLGVIAWRSTLGGYAPNFVSATDFDRRHSINLIMDYRLGEDEGPMLFGAHPLANFGVNVVANLGSGMPYTKLQSTPFKITDNFTANVRGGINEGRMPWSSLVNLRIDRAFEIGNGASLTAFVWVQNLLDTDNVLGVFRSSGLPDIDGYLESEDGRRLVRNAGEALGDARASEAYAYHYSRYANSPVALVNNHFAGGLRYSLPRRTRFGVRLNF